MIQYRFTFKVLACINRNKRIQLLLSADSLCSRVKGSFVTVPRIKRDAVSYGDMFVLGIE